MKGRRGASAVPDEAPTGNVVVSLKPGQSVLIGEHVVVKLVEGQRHRKDRATLRVSAPKTLRVERSPAPEEEE